MVPQTLNGLRAISVRLFIPWRGVWTADVTVDVEATALAPTSGPAILVVGGKTLRGTIDPAHSGTFAGRAACRVVGGAGKWSQIVRPQHFAAPTVSTVVYNATAAEIGEAPVLDPTPIQFGEHFARVSGPASHVFRDRDWFVEPTTGVVSVTAWPPSVPDPNWLISDVDVTHKTVTIFSDSVVLPGTPIVDPRLGATILTARDVEQTFDKNGTQATVWCDTAVTGIDLLARTVRDLTGARYLKTYKYRFVLGDQNTLALQAITSDAPDLNPISQWTGLSGAKALLKPATEIVVGFAGGDPTQPYLVAFSSLATPLALFVDASTVVNVGIPTSPVALSIPTIIALGALQAEIAALGALIIKNHPGDTDKVTAAISAAVAALATAATALPSKKLLSE
jgi:hypothetical protein